jgi:hypothetical protein
MNSRVVKQALSFRKSAQSGKYFLRTLSLSLRGHHGFYGAQIFYKTRLFLDLVNPHQISVKTS